MREEERQLILRNLCAQGKSVKRDRHQARKKGGEEGGNGGKSNRLWRADNAGAAMAGN